MHSNLPTRSYHLSNRARSITGNNLMLLTCNILLVFVMLVFSHFVYNGLDSRPVNLHSHPITISIEGKEHYGISIEGSDPKQWFTLIGLKNYCTQQLQEKNTHHVSVWIKSKPTIAYGEVLAIIQWLNTKGITDVGLITNHSA